MLATPGCTLRCCNWHTRSHSCHPLTLGHQCRAVSDMQEYIRLMCSCHSMAHTKGKPAVCVGMQAVLKGSSSVCAINVDVQAVLVCKQCWCASSVGVQAMLMYKQCWCASSGPRIIDVDHRCIPNMASQILLHHNMCQPGRSLTGLGWTCAYKGPL